MYFDPHYYQKMSHTTIKIHVIKLHQTKQNKTKIRLCVKDKNNGKVRSSYDIVTNQGRNIAGQEEQRSKNIRTSGHTVHMNGNVTLNGSHCLMQSQALMFLDKNADFKWDYFLIYFFGGGRGVGQGLGLTLNNCVKLGHIHAKTSE